MYLTIILIQKFVSLFSCSFAYFCMTSEIGAGKSPSTFLQGALIDKRIFQSDIPRYVPSFILFDYYVSTISTLLSLIQPCAWYDSAHPYLFSRGYKIQVLALVNWSSYQHYQKLVEGQSTIVLESCFRSVYKTITFSECFLFILCTKSMNMEDKMPCCVSTENRGDQSTSNLSWDSS